MRRRVYLRQEKLWGLDDPLFPATKIVVGDSRHFEASGLDRKHWSSAGPIRAIFRDAFAAAGLSYFNPHSFRKTLALLGGQIARLRRSTRLGPRTSATRTC